MSYVEQQIVEEISVLPLHEQQKVLEFVKRLRSQSIEASEQESSSEQPKTFGEVAHQ